MTESSFHRSAGLSKDKIEQIQNHYLDKETIDQAKYIISDELRPIAHSHVSVIFPELYKYFLRFVPCCRKKHHHHHHYHHVEAEGTVEHTGEHHNHGEEHNHGDGAEHACSGESNSESSSEKKSEANSFGTDTEERSDADSVPEKKNGNSYFSTKSY